MQGWRSIGLGVSLLALTTACSATPMKRAQDLNTLLEAYRQQNTQLSQQRRARFLPGVRSLVVKKADPVVSSLVTVELDQAPLLAVIRRVLDEAGAAYVFRDVSLTDRVTARFDDVPLMRALELLLRSRGLAVGVEDGVIVVKTEEPKDGALKRATPSGEREGDKAAATEARMSVEVPLTYLDAAAATALLDGLYPARDGQRLVQFGAQPFKNTMLLTGPETEMKRAAAMLRSADHSPAHVLIEVLVIEFDRDFFERLATELKNYAGAQFSALRTAIGSLTTPALTFTYTSNATNRESFTPILDIIINEQRGRLISRPYLATLSGREATINIVRDRFVTIVNATGQVTTSPHPVTSGVKLAITPTVLPDGMIRMKLALEDSVFTPTEGNISVQVDKNAAATTMQVESGQAIIIGGLVRDQRVDSNTGLPWLRHIPLLNLAFANQQTTDSKQEVLVYVTPYLWSPALDPPITNPGTFTIREREKGRELSNFERFHFP